MDLTRPTKGESMRNESSFLRVRVLKLGIAVAIGAFTGGGRGDCLARGDNSPTLFAPGVVSGPADDQSPAFAPDGKSLYFTRRNGSAATILKSTFASGHWMKPTVASFSGQWRDIEPAMAPDGAYLIFASNRPSIEGGSALDGNYNGKIRLAAGGNLWRVDRKGDGWGVPARLPDAINQGTAVFAPSIAADGSVYFMKWVEKTAGFHLFRSQYESGQYMAAKPVGVGDPTTDEVDPAIAPDESFLVYSSSHPAKNDQTRLLIAFRVAGGWGTPQDLGDEVNEKGDNIESRLSPDHRTLYFSTNTVPPVSFPRTRQQSEHDLQEMTVWANGRQNIWYVSLAPLLDAKQP
jgi:Tol biopolymer transport system component